MRWTAFVLRNGKAILTLALLLAALGAFLATRLPVAIFPPLTVPRIAVEADAGDLPVPLTLNEVTRPLEAAVSVVPGVVKVGSTTARGSASLDVTFAEGTDMLVALQRAQGRIAEVQPTLPSGTSVTAAALNPSLFPIMGYSLTATSESEPVNLVRLRSTALYTLRPRLARLPGVAQVRITGGDTAEYQVEINPAALAARALSAQDVIDALAHTNSVDSVGQYDRGFKRYEVLVSGLLHNADDIRRVAIATKNRVPITIADIATVRSSVAPRLILATGDGHPGVILNVIKQPDANTIQVAQEVRDALSDRTLHLPGDVRLGLFYDQSVIVQQSESSVIESIVIGGVLALVVLVLFLGNLRSASIVLILLPMTLLVTFGLMRALGMTLNIMTLGALAIALGMVIDDGIVVVENISHHLEQGESRSTAVASGMQAITPALVGSSLTTMGAFFPLLQLSGVTGQFFAPLAVVMIATLAVSLLLALTFGPLLATLLLPRNVAPAGSAQKGCLAAAAGIVPFLFDRVAAAFGKILLFCLRWRWIVLALMIPVAWGAYALFGRLPTGFFPEFDEGAFVIDYRMPAGTSLSETDRACRGVEEILKQTPEIASWSRLTGALSGSGLELCEQNQGDILVRLKADRTRPVDEVMDGVRKQIAGGYPQFDTDMAQILQDGIGDIAGTPAPIEVKIYGPDTDMLDQLASSATDRIGKVPGVVDVTNGVVQGGPERIVTVDGVRASRFGLTTDAIQAAATTALRGTIATSIPSGEAAIGVRVRAPNFGGYEALPDLRLAAPSGGAVPLSNVADITVLPGSPQITRENQQNMAAITARLEGRDLGSGVRDVQAHLSQLALPAGYRIEYGGLYASQQASFAELARIGLLAFLLVATLLLIQLRSFRQALTLIVAAVLSLSGVLLGLYLTGTPLNISSFTGAILVIGIVTEDGIVFFDVVNTLRHTHPERTLIETVLEARRLRLRPILMTILAAILALAPLALGLGAGAAMQKPLAIAVISGLAASTLFTLIVAPVLFVTVGARTERPAPL